MSDRPKLPSEMHPDYPKGVPRFEVRNGIEVMFADPTWTDRFVAFQKAHPEFASEGEYKFCCPFCGEENGFEDQGGYCCGEVGHCEWVYHEVEPA